MIPESSIVNVSVNVSQAAITQAGFGLICIFGNSTTLPSGQRYGLYSSMAGVAAVFSAGSAEYAAAQIVFSASPAPTQVMIARMFNAGPIPAELLGSAAPVTTLASYTAITNGAMNIVIDGTPETLSGINLSACGSLNAVATTIQTAVAAVKVGSTVTYSNGQFILRSGTTGATSTLAFPTAPGTGTDLSPLLGFYQAAGATLTQGAVAETVAQALANVNTQYSNFYMFSLAYASPADADLAAAAAFALANQKIFGYTTSESTAVTAGNTTDIGSVIQATTNSRAFGLFDLASANPYGVLAAFADAATVDFSGSNTAITLMFKQLAGVSISNISTTQKTTLDGKNYNYYVSVGGNPMLMKGVMSDGSYFDQVQGLDWLANAIQASVFAGLYGSKKVPQTDRGMASIMHWIEVVLQQGVRNGLLAPGVWNAAGVGQIATGQYLDKGYYAWCDTVNNQSQATRQTRIAPPVTILAKGAGALQGINIQINFQQ